MQLTNVITAIVALAMTATALPAAEPVVAARTGSSCNANYQPVCCNQHGGLGLQCTVLSVLLGGLLGGNNCDGGNVYCCPTNAAPVRSTHPLTLCLLPSV
ncbi:hypothetical protein B0T24DRAFT_643038 [Lasiosphaeria ovina]|uniref:Hydrophobin n=1 Tax=Lasiosphaeria ovina TaxID=92902 RepID=A0AAE0MYE9_9PEZI|nr:hypothetical protein B0T24DRAFT_643038 [Lasiosphaeria ovina]